MDYEEARRLIDNTLWTRGELKKLRGKTARKRSIQIANKLYEIHRPWYQRYNENTINFDFT